MGLNCNYIKNNESINLENINYFNNLAILKEKPS
jgi:hypothetical protein